MKILKRIGLFAVAILMVVGAFFLPKTLKSANADNTSLGNTTFTSSDIIYAFTPYARGIYNDFNGLITNSITSDLTYDNVLNYSFQFSIDSINSNRLGWDMSFGFKASYVSNIFLDDIPNEGAAFERNGYIYQSIYVDTAVFDHFSMAATDTDCYYVHGSTYYYTSIGFAVDPSLRTSTVPTGVITTIEIGSTVSSGGVPYKVIKLEDSSVSQDFSNSNFVAYTDTAGYRYIYYIPCRASSSESSFFLKYRKYFTDEMFDFSNNSFYQQGVNDGKASGYNNGYNIGYRDGTVVGYDNGYSVGYDDGVFESNDYSFFGLITAVIDAPVRILTSLFNFNFLGINLWLFITSLLTISLVVVVLRKFMGKG